MIFIHLKYIAQDFLQYFSNSVGNREYSNIFFDDYSGVKPVDKKDGSGSHNWGTFEDEIKAEDDKANISADLNETTVENENANETSPVRIDFE